MKKQILIIILICLVIIIGLGVYFYITRPAVKIDGGSTLPLSQTKKLDPLNVKNLSDCDSFTEKNVKNTCRWAFIIKQATTSGNLDKCSEMGSKELSNDCLAQASFSLAIQKKDKKYCDKILNKRDKESCLKVLTDMGVK